MRIPYHNEYYIEIIFTLEFQTFMQKDLANYS